MPPELVPRGVDLLLRKLLSHSLLSTEDQNAIAALPFTLRRLDAGGVIIREGERCDICPILLSGFAHRHKMTGDGGRQIVARSEEHTSELQSLMRISYAVFCLKK